jgi:hypothetical protein
MSYRSHVEAYIVCEPEREDPAWRRRRLQESYAERREAVKRRVRRLLHRLELAPERLPGWLNEVIAVHRRYAERALRGVEDGTIRLKDLEDTDQPRPFRLGASDFHAAVAGNRAIRELDRMPIMVADRLVLNLLYLHLSRTGMINEDRYILDYYIAEAIEDLFHISPVDVVRNFHGLAS